MRELNASIKSFQASWVAGPGLVATGSTPLTPGALTATTDLRNSGLRARSMTLLIAIRPNRRFQFDRPGEIIFAGRHPNQEARHDGLAKV